MSFHTGRSGCSARRRRANFLPIHRRKSFGQ
jgi:hypothetical protein